MSQRVFEDKDSAGIRLVELHLHNRLHKQKLDIVQSAKCFTGRVGSTKLMPVKDTGDGSDMIRYPTRDYLAPASIWLRERGTLGRAGRRCG